MKRGTTIALVILVILVAIFFATRQAPETNVSAPYEVSKVEKLDRIEVTRPGDDDKLVVLQKKGEQWRLTKPVDALVSEAVAKDLDTIFSRDIATDTLNVPKEKLAEYELEDDKAVTVALYSEGADQPTVRFGLGKEMTVEATRMRRSYVKSDAGKPYWARRSLEFLRGPVKAMRNAAIHTGESSAVREILIQRGEDELKFDRSAEGWDFLFPRNEDVEQSVANAMAGTLSNLKAEDFVDGASPEEYGLEPAQVVIDVKYGEDVVRFFAARKDGASYVRKAGDPQIYKIAEAAADRIMPTLLQLRDRVPAKFEGETILGVNFAGADRVAIQKEGETWQMVRPEKAEIPEAKVSSFLATLTRLRVSSYVEISPEAAGLEKPEGKVDIKSDKGVRTLRVGALVEDGNGDRYGQWEGRDFIFVIPKSQADRLMPKASDFKG